jgi:hypothetical protein
VTDLKSFDEAKRLLREWAVTNDLFYGGGYLYFENENLYRLFWEARREPEAEKLP